MVGYIESRALEDNPHRLEQSVHTTPTFRTNLHGVISKFLNSFKPNSTCFTLVLIKWHSLTSLLPNSVNIILLYHSIGK